MFDEYKKRLEELEANAPKVFKAVAGRSAKHFADIAKDLTDREKLVDTGNYKRNWHAEVIEPQKNTYGIAGINTVEYASFIEEGHKMRNGKKWKGRFVGKRAMTDTEGFALLELRQEIDILMTQKKYNVSRSEAKKSLGY